MKATKTSKADQIRKALIKSPNQSKAALAKKLGVSSPYVYGIAKKMAVGKQAATSPVEGQGDAYEHKDGKWKTVSVAFSDESATEKLTGTDALLAERGSRYGTFADHAEVTQVLKCVIHGHAHMHEKELSAAQAEALDMIAHKIGRIVNGDPNYADSWRDIEGYAKLVADELEFGKKV